MSSRRPLERFNRGRTLQSVAATDPASILGASLKLDLDGDLGITLGTGVSAWADQSGSGNNVAQGTGSLQFGYLTAQVNGHNVVDCDGVDDFMAGPAVSNILTANAWTVWVVCSDDADNTNDASVFLNDGLICDAGAFWGVHIKSAPTLHIYQFDGSTDTDSTATATGAYRIVRARHNGTTIFIKSGSAAESAGVASGSITNLTGLLRIGRNGSTGLAYYDGKIAKILASNAVATPAQLSGVDAFLTARYAL